MEGIGDDVSNVSKRVSNLLIDVFRVRHIRPPLHHNLNRLGGSEHVARFLHPLIFRKPVKHKDIFPAAL